MRKYNIKIDKKNITCVDFNGLIDQYRLIESELRDKKYRTVQEQENEVYNTWWGTHSLSETVNGMSYGFDNSTQYFLENVERTKYNVDKNDGLYMTENGNIYDMGSVVSGVPECCLDFGVPNPAPYIKIMIDITFPCNFSEKEIYNRGLAILTLIQTLIICGCIIDLYMFELNIQSDKTIMYTNKFDVQNLSIANLAFLCSPEYFRRIGFITTECIREKESEWGCGNSCLPQFIIDKLKRDKIFYIGGGYTDNELSKNLTNIEDTMKCLLEKFNNFCIENKLDLNFDLKEKSNVKC